MIPFPGESLAVYSYENRSGDPIPSLADIQLRGGGSTFGVSSVAKVVVYFGVHYLESADVPGTVSWAIEVEAVASSATLRLTECLGNGEPGVPLGDFVVTGPGTLVVDSTAITMADVYNETFGSLLVECVAGGLVTVEQIKLRAFPVGGPLGAWDDTVRPGWTMHTPPLFDSISRQSGIGVLTATWGPSDPVPLNEAGVLSAWPLTVALLPDKYDGGVDDSPALVSDSGEVTGTTDFHSVITLATSSSDNPDPLLYGATGRATLSGTTGALVSRTRHAPEVNPDEGLVDGVDYIANPYEVHEDSTRILATGTPTNTWDNVYTIDGITYAIGELIEVDVPLGNYPPDVSVPLIGALPWAPSGSAAGGDLTNLWPDQASDVPANLTLPETDQVLIGTAHPWYLEAYHPPAPDGGAVGGDRLNYSVSVGSAWSWHFTQPITYRVDFPPYQVWNVNAIKRRPLRQLHRDDGQGGTPPRAFGGASRIRTGRAYGYD